MKLCIIGLLTFMTFTSQAKVASPLKIDDILNRNVGKATGIVKGFSDMDCDLEVDNKSIPDGFAVIAGLGANVTFMIFPTDFWLLDENAHTLTYFADELKKDFVQITFIANSLKLTSYTHYHNSGTVVGNTCLLK